MARVDSQKLSLKRTARSCQLSISGLATNVFISSRAMIQQGTKNGNENVGVGDGEGVNDKQHF